ncbi:MAG: hypothetical protein KC506_01315, partial [Nanoarchaeota archaeon]|nr:hypothetical protein [Nanoarchaeota archaeon]
MIKSKNYESKELKELQRYKLERLLEQSKDNVPYWNMLITSSGIIDESISVKDALQKLPILSKEVIRENGERMWSTKHKKYIVATTGGTTGYPLTIRRDYHCQAVNKAALWRAKMSWGVEPKSKTLYLNSFGKGTF